MNVNLYYRGVTVTNKIGRLFDIQSLLDCSLPKFDHNYHQELLLFGNNLRLRLKRSNTLLNFDDIVGYILKENDTIIIEPKENLTTSNQSIHAPKRYDLTTIDNSYSPVVLKPTDYSQMKNNINSKSQNVIKHPYSTDVRNPAHKYQKSVQSPGLSKCSHNFSSPFNRTDLRRSLGADIAPQFETHDYSRNRADNSNNYYDSESSISDIVYFTKSSVDNKCIQLCGSQIKASELEKHKSISKSAPASPTKPAPPPRSPHTHISMLNSYNVRTIGNKINISIVKKPNVGLGFTIVTRDNQVLYGSAADIANSVVILVNKILPNGGAAENNRLRPGDRLLEVNDVPVKSLKEATEKLRAIPENEEVNLLISRVERFETPFNDQLSENSSPQSSIKQLTIEIPLNQNQRQQLGLNIMRSNDQEISMGPGVYIHSILPNSLASQQGVLMENDKLIGINGRSLNDNNVEETINTLKKVMQNDSILSITICRAIPPQILPYNNETTKKDPNYFILPNKMSLDKKTRESIESHTNVYNSRYSSSDSLSHKYSGTQTEQVQSFVRESKGRRSMSDKRKAHEDASQYTFYQETRMGDVHVNDDRLYSTLPTASRLKKMKNNQSPYLPNKTHAPVKPSQIKQLNTPKNVVEQGSKVPKTPNRSISLRNSPTRLKQPSIDVSQNDKSFNQTPTHEQQQGFNRAMNNSFKRAVQKSLPENGQTSNNLNSTEKLSSCRTEVTLNHNQTDNQYPIYSSRQTTEKIPRSNSVKVPEDKKKSFNLKSFLTFTPNVTRTKSISAKEKSDTFPLNQPLRYQQSSCNYNGKHPSCSPNDLPHELLRCDDPVIIDSTKRVLEWQMKNEDVISKENKFKDHKIYQTVSTHGAGNFKNMTDINQNARIPVSNKNAFHMNVRSGHDTDPYDSIDGTVTSPQGVSKPKSGQSRSIYGNSHSQLPISPKDNTPSFNNRTTYQIIPSRKTSPPNDIYATINKGPKKEVKSPKQPSSASHSHINKYRF